ncbi:MAG: MnhB domain-containing protein, partial [Aquabacterium sp.]|nr:MnhB domain-containing protein [Aquabacterium sp.]
LGHAPPAYQLALWHGLNLPLQMSAVALAGGVAFYFALQRRYNLHLHHPRGLTGRLLYTRALDGLLRGARWLIGRLDTGSLQRHVAVLLSVAMAAAAWPFVAAGMGVGAGTGAPVAGTRTLLPADALSVLVWAGLLAVCVALVRGHRDRLQAVVLVGVIGLITALSFAALSAPDLALTQLSVEVVSTVLLLMGLALLPPTSPRESSAARRWRDGGLALAGGAGMAWLSWLVLTRDHDSISWFFLDQSLPQGGGSNVVNVILVDFRGYDTFGEITVLGIAALGVLALLDGWRVRRPLADAQGRPWRFARPPLMLRHAARLVLPLALVLSAYLFWRGHNLPGGGFIAALVTAVALVLQSMALGQVRAEALLQAAGGQRFVRWIGIGLGVAGLTGLGAFAFGQPFLTSAFGHPVLPLLGELPLASAALFDLGVYITVVGATLLTLSVLGAASQSGTTSPVRGEGR